MKKIFLILAAAVALLQIALVSCSSSPKSPPENVEPSPVFKSEGITFDGSEWFHARFADKKGITQAFMKNMPIIITVKFGLGYPEADEMKIKLDYKKIKYKFYKWQGKYAATDTHIELFVTDYAEGYKDGVGGYGSLTDYCELSYSLDGDTLTIHTPLSDILYSADELEKGYSFPVPLVLTKEQYGWGFGGYVM